MCVTVLVHISSFFDFYFTIFMLPLFYGLMPEIKIDFG